MKLSMDLDDPKSPDTMPFKEFSDQLGLGFTLDANFDLLINTTRKEAYDWLRSDWYYCSSDCNHCVLPKKLTSCLFYPTGYLYNTFT